MGFEIGGNYESQEQQKKTPDINAEDFSATIMENKTKIQELRQKEISQQKEEQKQAEEDLDAFFNLDGGKNETKTSFSQQSGNKLSQNYIPGERQNINFSKETQQNKERNHINVGKNTFINGNISSNNPSGSVNIGTQR